MPRIADYAVIQDQKFTIKQNAGDKDKTFNFTLESGAHLSSRSILAFVINVSQANNCKFIVQFNVVDVDPDVGTFQITYPVNGNLFFQTLHEVINPNVLKSGANNVRFQIVEGTGTLTFSDVVLLYQRDV